jgi:tripartite-type tricarboxylate transporter receptor subunit TctC
MEVHPSVPIMTVSEFIAYARANPGKISLASGGSGSAQHINGELLKVATRVNMTHVPYRGNAPAVTDLLGGQVQVVPSITAEGFLPQARLRRRTRPVSSHRNLADEPG